MKEQRRKVTRIGNSLGVSMTDALRELKLDLGDMVNIKVRGDEIIIRRAKKQIEIPDNFDPDFFDHFSETMDEYRDTIKGLKDR